MKRILVLVFCAVMTSSVVGFGAQRAPDRRISADPTSLPQAEDWMKMLDQGSYDQARNTASDYFRTMFSVDFWKGTMAARSAGGGVVDRTMLSQQVARGIPGYTTADPVLIVRYRVRFFSADESVDTVVVGVERGSAKVLTYSRTPVPSSTPSMRPLYSN